MDVNLDFCRLLNPSDLKRQRRINRALRWTPRLSVLGTARLAVTRQVFRLATIGAGRRHAGGGLSLQRDQLENIERTPVRIFRPRATPRAVVVDFHGGAWAIGLAAMDDRLNAGISRECTVTVASIDYKLALPGSITDVRSECIAATSALLQRPEFRHLPVFFTGESAGAHLALSVAQALRSSSELAGRFAGMVLNYGVYDLAGTASALRADGDTLVLHGTTLQAQIDRLCGDVPRARRRAPVLSPLYGPMVGLPPALVVVGSLDPLVDDSRELAKKLRSSGIRTELLYLPEAPHGLLHMSGSYAAKLRQYERDWYNRQIDANWSLAHDAA